MHGGGTARIHSQVMNWNQPPRCHVYCLGSSMVRHCSRAGATSTGGQHSATARGVPWEPPLATRLPKLEATLAPPAI